jgi:DNA invertase Pin-like site-specific DNA recombinase
MSGAVADRPELKQALEFPRSGNTLVVWKLDRLARSVKQLIDIVEKLRARRIGFRSLTEALDTTTAQGRLVFHMFSALAESSAAWSARGRKPGWCGRPSKLSPEDMEVAKTMLANPDIGVTDIAHRLGVSPATLYRHIPAARASNASIMR